jgi:hypothetical protein
MFSVRTSRFLWRSLGFETLASPRYSSGQPVFLRRYFYWSGFLSKEQGVNMGFKEHKSIQVFAWRYTRTEQLTLRSIAALCLVLMTILPSTFAFLEISPRPDGQSPTLRGRAADNSSLLECLQVAPPVLGANAQCQQTLMVYTFGSSYGQPFIGESVIHQKQFSYNW